MQIEISGHHVEVTPALREYVSTKLEKLSRHFDHITNTHVTLTVEKSRQRVDAKIHVSGADIVASSESEDMYSAIDTMSDKLDRQLIKYKEKIQDKKQGLIGR
ncbi:MAG: putative sigma-54 modulation protein [Pseudomonadales bacterium]|jgi:putative sigma-54 modulation protein